MEDNDFLEDLEGRLTPFVSEPNGIAGLGLVGCGSLMSMSSGSALLSPFLPVPPGEAKI